MEDHTPLFDRMTEQALAQGAYKAAVIRVPDIQLDASFRTLCESNVCGNYGKCWKCPPDAGEIGELMRTLRTFDYALVYQTVGTLEDSYDFEGMMAAAGTHSDLIQSMMELYPPDSFARVLHLGAGGCHVCPVCAKREGVPCRHPDRAVASLETYGVNVSALAATCGMKYVNGQNTVTYFGAVLFVL